MVFLRLFPELLLDYYPGLLPKVYPGCPKVFLDISVGVPSEVSLRAPQGTSLKRGFLDLLQQTPLRLQQEFLTTFAEVV